MFNAIVVGTDGSETATEAVNLAAKLADEHGASLHIVSAFSGAMTPEQAKMAVGGVDNTAVLGMSVAEVRALRVTPETHVLTGDPADCLVQTADSIGADLIVVGNTGMSAGLRGRFLSSVPNKVAHAAGCAVLIVPTG